MKREQEDTIEMSVVVDRRGRVLGYVRRLEATYGGALYLSEIPFPADRHWSSSFEAAVEWIQCQA